MYDAALEFLQTHQSRCLSKLDKLKARPNPGPAQLQHMDELDVDANVNDPAIRHLFSETRGVGHMHRPVIRHLAERRWKQAGGLDLIMGRIYQNKVVPDLLPDIGPTNPFTLSITEGSVEPGLVIDCQTLKSPPALHYQPFQHPTVPESLTDAPEALYTLLMVDPDSPDSDKRAYSQRLHYLKTDIALSILTGQSDINERAGNIIVQWEPPAPPEGSGIHRYVFMLLRQTSTSNMTAPERDDFDLRAWLTTNGFSTASIYGINLVRAQWTKEANAYINAIWREHRGATAAPVYSRPSRENRYAMPVSGLQQRAAAIRQRAWEKSLEDYAKVGLAEGISDLGEGSEEDTADQKRLATGRAKILA